MICVACGELQLLIGSLAIVDDDDDEDDAEFKFGVVSLGERLAGGVIFDGDMYS